MNILNLFKSISKSIKTRFFFLFLLSCLFYGIILYYILYGTYYKATLLQSDNNCKNYITATRTTLSSFINEIFAVTKMINNDAELIEILNDCYYSKNEISPEITIKIENILKNYISTNNKITSLRLYVDNDAGFYQTKNFYATSDRRVISEDYMGRSKWYNAAYEGDGKVIFRPTYKKMFSLPESMSENKSFDYTENIMSFFKVLKNNRGVQLAVVSIDVDESIIYNMTQSLSLPNNSQTFITTHDGTIISSSNKNYIGKNVYSKIPFMPKTNITDFNRTISDDYIMNQSIFYYEDWKIVTLTSKKSLFMDMKVFNKVITSFLLFFSFLALSLSAIMTNFFTIPINKLLKSIENVRNGDLSARIKIDSYTEISEVQESFNNMLDSIQQLLNENYEIRLREKEAQLKSLEAQINPHFLYNTLDTINWKVYLLGGEDISKLITSLSQILRYSINNKIKIVKLSDEISQIENYLFIQKARYDDRFKIIFKLDPNTLDLHIHKFMLQPIVENAIIHGLEEKDSDGIICISSKIKDDSLIIQIFDNGVGIDKETLKDFSEITGNSTVNKFFELKKNHIGIENVHNRIRFQYGNQYGLKIKSKKNFYTLVTLSFPIEK